MKQIIIILTLVFPNAQAFGQSLLPRKSFDQLMTFDITMNKVSVSLDSSTSIIYNCNFDKIINKPSGFNLEDFECEINAVIIADVLYDRSNKKRGILTFGNCPEDEFFLYDINSKELIQSFSARSIVIPGNGSIYTSGHLGNYNLRQKFSFDGKLFKEDKQPFYYVGLASKTLREIRIYSDKELKSLLAILPANYEIEVILTDEPYNSKYYLVKTSFGLIGWAELKAEQYKSVDIDGLFYNND